MTALIKFLPWIITNGGDVPIPLLWPWIINNGDNKKIIMDNYFLKYFFIRDSFNKIPEVDNK